MRRTFALALLAFSFAMSGCNTVHGFGKDVSSAGDAVANAADKTKK